MPQHHTAAGLQWDYCPIWLSYSGTLVYASGLWYQRAVVWGQLTLNSGWSRASPERVWARRLATSHLSHAPQHHTAAGLQWDYCPIWLSYSGTLVYASGLQYQQAVVWGQLTLNFGRFQASVGALTCHVTPLSRAPTSHGCWSAVGLLSHLAFIFGPSCLCFWAAVSASRCVGAADFEIWQVLSEC